MASIFTAAPSSNKSHRKFVEDVRMPRLCHLLCCMKALILRGLLILISLFLAVQLWVFGALVWWQFQPVERSMFMHCYEWTGQTPALKHQWVDSNQINNSLKRALVAGEDGRFMDHHGFDWTGIQAALERNQKKGRVVAGGSTISQQLSKNLFLWNERSYIRKAQEFIITWMMEQLWSKDRILTVYLNSIEFGKGIYGAEAAARHYYGKSAKTLSAQESARLAGLVPNPVYYQAHPSDRRYKKRVRMIARYMRYSRIPVATP
jgi:monofunctional biosynthetic peptidoglycan transglycosylase